MSVVDPLDKLVAHFKADDADLRALVSIAFYDMGYSEELFEGMEPICVKVLGARVKCTACSSGTENFPGVECWECGAVDGVRDERC